MDTNALKTFIAIAELGSFTLAAESLYLTQPAISKRIQALETELQTSLFDRIGRKVSLTESGKVLFQHAKNILQHIENSRIEIANLKSLVTGHLTFATSHHIGLHRLPPYLKQYSNLFRNVELDIHFMASETACHAVQNGNYEFAIVTLPNAKFNNIETTVLWQDELVPVCAKTHPLIKHVNTVKNSKQSVKLTSLSQYPAILPGETTYTRQLIDRHLDNLGITIKTSMATNNLETIKMLVSVGLGWSLLPTTMLEGKIRKLNNMQSLGVSRELGIIRHTDRTLSNASRKFIELVKN